MRGVLHILIGFVLFCTGCHYSNREHTISVNNTFSMTVPEYLSEVDNLKGGAEFQYSNRFRNLYVVVFSSPKSIPFDSFYSQQSNIIKGVLLKPTIDDSTAVAIEGGHAIHTSLSGKMQGEMIYYELLTVEARDKFYQAAVWTRSEDRKLKYGKDMERILLSFRLLHP